MPERFRQIPGAKEYLARKAVLRRTAGTNLVAHWSHAFDRVPEPSKPTPTKNTDQESLISARGELQVVLSDIKGLKPLIKDDGWDKQLSKHVGREDRVQTIYQILGSEAPLLTSLTNALVRNGFDTREKIASLTDGEILRTRQIGERSARIIRAMRKVAKAELKLLETH